MRSVSVRRTDRPSGIVEISHNPRGVLRRINSTETIEMDEQLERGLASLDNEAAEDAIDLSKLDADTIERILEYGMRSLRPH